MSAVPDCGKISSDRRIINRSAVKTHALKVSKALRAGKFTRVGEAFLEEVEVDAESLIREIRVKFATGMRDPVLPDEGTNFVTGEMLEAIKRELDFALARLVQNKVQRHPSVGCTLRNSR
jgi:hypothetical protein